LYLSSVRIKPGRSSVYECGMWYSSFPFFCTYCHYIALQNSGWYIHSFLSGRLASAILPCSINGQAQIESSQRPKHH
jgi:hypothetical protein